jgi:hypothetical protein
MFETLLYFSWLYATRLLCNLIFLLCCSATAACSVTKFCNSKTPWQGVLLSLVGRHLRLTSEHNGYFCVVFVLLLLLLLLCAFTLESNVDSFSIALEPVAVRVRVLPQCARLVGNLVFIIILLKSLNTLF